LRKRAIALSRELEEDYVEVWIPNQVQRSGSVSRGVMPIAVTPEVWESAVAVGVRRGVATLQSHLVRAKAVPVVAGEEEPLVEGRPPGGWISVDLRDPGALGHPRDSHVAPERSGGVWTHADDDELARSPACLSLVNDGPRRGFSNFSRTFSDQDLLSRSKEPSRPLPSAEMMRAAAAARNGLSGPVRDPPSARPSPDSPRPAVGSCEERPHSRSGVQQGGRRRSPKRPTSGQSELWLAIR